MGARSGSKSTYCLLLVPRNMSAAVGVRVEFKVKKCSLDAEGNGGGQEDVADEALRLALSLLR